MILTVKGETGEEGWRGVLGQYCTSDHREILFDACLYISDSPFLYVLLSRYLGRELGEEAEDK